MTNNLKAERTLTAELIAAAQNVYDKLASETATVTIFDQERLGDALRYQSLSTQKPMGEPVAWMHTLHMEHGQTSVSVDMEEEPPYGEAGEDYDPSYFVTSTPLYALHPNQESGE